MNPIILVTWSFGDIATNAGWAILSRAGEDTAGSAIDAVEAGCRAVEVDPSVNSVGFGGLPDASGRMSLDGCIMLSPSECGSVCFVRQHVHPVSVARRVMEDTPHVMLAGRGADTFATEHGFPPTELLSDAAEAKWLERHASRALSEPQVPEANIEEQIDRSDSSNQAMPRPDSPNDGHDTVGVLALDQNGILAGACSTSGWPFKRPGRVGDSPIIGHGLYVDPKHGAAVATGSGELVMGVCGTFLAVEMLRQGQSTEQAAKTVLDRIAESYDLEPNHQVGLIVLTPDGDWTTASLRPGYSTVVQNDEKSLAIDPGYVMFT